MVRACDETLLDVFQAVREVAANEQETLATTARLLTNGQVRLSGDAIRAIYGAPHTAMMPPESIILTTRCQPSRPLGGLREGARYDTMRPTLTRPPKVSAA
jgi:hypothetical protein